MLKIAICDDEPVVLVEIEKKVKEIILKLNVSASYYVTEKPVDLLSILKREAIDILLLDIDMPLLSGMDIAKALCEEESKTLFIFITNQEALVYESLRYHPFGFIRKSCYEFELEIVLTNAIVRINKNNDTIFFKNGAESVRLKLSDIQYFESDSNYVKLYTDTTLFRYRETLQMLENELHTKGFVRIHKGYLVNQQAIHVIRYDELELVNGKLLPIGRSNRDYVRSQLMKYMR